MIINGSLVKVLNGKDEFSRKVVYSYNETHKNNVDQSLKGDKIDNASHGIGGMISFGETLSVFVSYNNGVLKLVGTSGKEKNYDDRLNALIDIAKTVVSLDDMLLGTPTVFFNYKNRSNTVEPVLIWNDVKDITLISEMLENDENVCDVLFLSSDKKYDEEIKTYFIDKR